MKGKNQKKFLVLKLIAFESGTKYSHNPEQDTGYWQPLCYATRLNLTHY